MTGSAGAPAKASDGGWSGFSGAVAGVLAWDKGSWSEGKLKEGLAGADESSSAPGKINLGALFGVAFSGAFFSGFSAALSFPVSESGVSVMRDRLGNCWQFDGVLSMLC